ncbi:class I SAM-dependent DNA methyltransferase [Xanthomonas vasicola]|uniref:class I SAM-dependent DNA methyltransferase n=1 Tax=Xanthomonas vasicola TaxID=56459 RepID=UPI0001CC0CDC|nr:DNA methyltransferase [Xanthomonas vasicola]AZR31068.1 class I SAM-dependent DNA methyltransferase [Xanthomonas vasicola pv. musacearum NCPPB 4379]KFA05894.1 lactate dehydrogenase [Xanthomonas vasicola pv. musacearum NCPPB 4380]KFA16784.1 lactate dehydrogenase [Xanthomonas vasicola pv. musacearum NCPPB 4392]KFA19175.1 lactate dehydrogenase [Xanthomonas vasicola pv. musacearum NCPPB 4394]MBV6742717.1 class I SAM-dependent DNA methyltransferase [Xanthomonas vasicola pv. musacearum NCPPB 2251]
MNAVEIEQAITDLAERPFDPAEFPYAFLEAFGNKPTTIKRLRAGASNKSDLGGVLQTSNIHILTCDAGRVTQTLAALKASPATAKAKAKFILATDGTDFEAEDLTSGETVACAFKDFPDHFGFFLPLAGISTVRQISENAFDIRATSRLNRLYVELLKDNPEWGTAERRHDMNKLMARLIFCFFAEDTDIFVGKGRFTETIAQMSAKDSSNTHEVIATLFRTMNTKREDRAAAKVPRWAEDFPYVNGQLFSGGDEVPRFSKIARSYLLHVGGLDWIKINPDIFGSMIQAVAEDEERGELGMHYTSVPNILKVLNPLFLDDLREKLEEAGDNARMLLNLRKRIAKIRVFDPACGSGNFLVIAYKEMRAIEAEINQRRGEPDRASGIPLTNFRGIELRDFPAEIARLALVIAEYQCDVLYRGQKLALAEFLPLRNENWITCGNALRLDWLSVCPPTGTDVKLQGDDLFETPLDQAEIDFQNEGGETYICGNPPYRGSKWQSDEQKADLANAWAKHPKLAKTTDFVTGWFARFFDYADKVPDAVAAFVATNSVCQGQQASEVWPAAFERGCEIRFAHTSFKWANLAAHNAGVTVVVIGLGKKSNQPKRLYQDDMLKQCTAIGPYLVPDSLAYVQKANDSIGEQSVMLFGNMPRDGGNLLMDTGLARKVMADDAVARPFIKRFIGSEELINGKLRYCFWIEDDEVDAANASEFIAQRLKLVVENRSNSPAESTRGFAKKPHRFVQIAGTAKETAIVVPKVSSESREYLPVGFVTADTIVSDLAFALYDAPLWNMAFIASRLHLVWIATVCGKLETRYRYSNTIGWNTFPVPTLTDKNKADLTRCAEDILLAREHHFPATIADMYDPENMPADLRAAHDRNDEVLERIYIGRRFKNDTERLEKLFDLYTKMTASAAPAKGKKRKAGANA